jgi:Tfp pilus assembly protein PilF
LRTQLTRSITFVLALLLILPATYAQVRGKGRLQGSVTDKQTGKPVANATVTVSGANTKPVVTKTNAKGTWSAIGLTNGTWNIDIEAQGYQTLHGSVAVSEFQMIPPIKSELEAMAPEAPAAPAIANVPDEVVNAVNEAQDLMKSSVGDPIGAEGTATVTAEMVKEDATKAAGLLETALPQIPTDTPERVNIRTQVQQLMAQAQYKAGQLPKAIETMKGLVAADANNTGNALLLVNLYLEDGKLDEGKALLEKLPDWAVSDPTVYLNVGILFLNKDSGKDGVVYFDKAIALDANRAESYYYRGLAHLQLKHNAEAKADFQKVLELAPNGSEAKDAKQLLDGLK